MIDPDIWRAARLVLERYGADAVPKAATRAADLARAGDTDGAAVWDRILAAVDELLRPTPGEGDAVH